MAFVNLLRTPEVARMLGVSITKLEHMRSAGAGPVFVRVGRSVRYKPQAIDTYLDQNSIISNQRQRRRHPLR